MNVPGQKNVVIYGTAVCNGHLKVRPILNYPYDIVCKIFKFLPTKDIFLLLQVVSSGLMGWLNEDETNYFLDKEVLLRLPEVNLLPSYCGDLRSTIMQIHRSYCVLKIFEQFETNTGILPAICHRFSLREKIRCLECRRSMLPKEYVMERILINKFILEEVYPYYSPLQLLYLRLLDQPYMKNLGICFDWIDHDKITGKLSPMI